MDRKELIEFLRSLTDEERCEFEELLEYDDWKPALVGPKPEVHPTVDRGAFQKLFTPGLRKAFEDTYRCRK